MLRVDRPVLKKLSRRGRQSAVRASSTLCELFHENTKLTPLSGRAYGQHVARILASSQLRRQMAQPYKIYTLNDRVELDKPRAESTLEKTIVARRSTRRFRGAISAEQLSRLLFFSYGRTDPRGLFRAVASGGGLFPLEIYAVALHVEGLARGLYHYDAECHRLNVVSRELDLDELRKNVWLQDIAEPEAAAAILFVTAIFQRSTLKYLDRGYRLILIEAGEVAQNLGLLATSMGLGVCLLGGFIDNALSAFLGVDGLDEAPLLPIVVGRPEIS